VHAHTNTHEYTCIHTQKHIHRPRESHPPPSYEWQRTNDHPVTMAEQMHQYVYMSSQYDSQNLYHLTTNILSLHYSLTGGEIIILPRVPYS